MAERPPEAWVQIPTSDEIMAGLKNAGASHPYDWGFFPAMGRLIIAHGRIGAAFAQLFSQIMFAPEGVLTRQEREMVAAVTAAGQDCHY